MVGQSRPETPESPLTSSLYHATTTIDDLTVALTNYSRVPSPEPQTSLTCCCNQANCENLTAWLSLKSRLESRLILSAEVGQALLQRHEAYVRRHERQDTQPQTSHIRDSDDPNFEILLSGESDEVLELVKEKIVLEKRFNQALVNAELTEVSNKTLSQELQEARNTISRLSAQHARSIGLDERLYTAVKDRDDMQQERDHESHRARLAEARLTALKDTTRKLKDEVRRLQEALEEKRHNRLQSSESLLKDAKMRMESIYKLQVGVTAMTEQAEFMNVLESLVSDNETLKKDNFELQHLLADSREDLHALQEEVDEQRANATLSSGANTPHSRHFHTGSVPSISLKDYSMFIPKRSISSERRNRRILGPLTPETGRRPLSPAESLTHSERWTSHSSHQLGGRPPSSHVSYEIDEDAHDDDNSESGKPKALKTLLLLTRSRGVQTDAWPSMLSPAAISSHKSSSPGDPRSESSSFSESVSTHISSLMERAVSLLNRMAQADALTLTNRLKRQHLKGADVGHLSRSTVGNILSEVTNLRAQFRGFLEDDGAVITFSRKDLRVLFKFFKDVFTELGQLRVTLNDVILDPTSATRISEFALNPEKAEAELRAKEKDSSTQTGGGWMAPIQKLFAPASRGGHGAVAPGPISHSSSFTGNSRPSRFVPKLGPALAASATTVNVEFTGTGIGRAVTSTVEQPRARPPNSDIRSPEAPTGASGLMGIFAGAPQHLPVESWIVVPKGPRRVQSFMKANDTNSTIGRASGRKSAGLAGSISRNVDAIIDVQKTFDDDDEPDQLPPLLERTLRRRGLSDSSIRSTFTSHGDDDHHPVVGVDDGAASHSATHSDRASVFQALTRTVQNFRITASGTVIGLASATGSSSLPQPAHVNSSQPLAPKKAGTQPKTIRASSAGFGNFLPNLSLSSWAASDAIADSGSGTHPLNAGSSVIPDSFINRTRRPDDPHGRDYF